MSNGLRILEQTAKTGAVEFVDEMIKAAEVIKQAGIPTALKYLAVGGASAGAAGVLSHFLTKRHDIKQFEKIAPQIAEITTPREKQMMQQVFALGYRKGQLDLLQRLTKVKKKAEDEESKSELAKVLNTAAETLREQEQKIAELEAKVRELENEHKIVKLASKMVNTGMAASMEHAMSLAREAIENGDAEKIIDMIASKTNLFR